MRRNQYNDEDDGTDNSITYVVWWMIPMLIDERMAIDMDRKSIDVYIFKLITLLFVVL